MVGKIKGAGALPARTLRQLTDICMHLSIPIKIAHHGPTFTAAQTQAVLPGDCLVQKTVTGKVEDKLILWTGVGDFHIARKLHKIANKKMGLAAGRDHTLNPPEVDALSFYHMQPGMVSPFLISGSPAAHQLTALFVLDWSEAVDPQSPVAISLSLTESLVISAAHLDALFHAYAEAVYAHVPLFKLTGTYSREGCPPA
jgi:hypothetical protein